ncbi:hypothetical protein L7F22_010293 [Adiantum nelumboides]|nr:hypothetical protein [Adiantum nelumboides]
MVPSTHSLLEELEDAEHTFAGLSSHCVPINMGGPPPIVIQQGRVAQLNHIPFNNQRMRPSPSATRTPLLEEKPLFEPEKSDIAQAEGDLSNSEKESFLHFDGMSKTDKYLMHMKRFEGLQSYHEEEVDAVSFDLSMSFTELLHSGQSKRVQATKDVSSTIEVPVLDEDASCTRKSNRKRKMTEKMRSLHELDHAHKREMSLKEKMTTKHDKTMKNDNQFQDILDMTTKHDKTMKNDNQFQDILDEENYSFEEALSNEGK